MDGATMIPFLDGTYISTLDGVKVDIVKPVYDKVPDTVPFEADPEVGAVTVSQLKAIIAEWPELDEEGEPNQVWLATGDGLSSPCISVFQFSHMDIILEPDEGVWKQTGGSDVA